MATCEHFTLCLDVSSHAKAADYSRPTARQRLAATQPSGRANATQNLPTESTFPGPLVLPGDDLAEDPKYPPQSLRSWIREKDRNAVTNERRIIYLVPSPAVDESVLMLNSWAQASEDATGSASPAVDDVFAYLQAFYHGLEVKVLADSKLKFNTWGGKPRKKRAQRQLNLKDLLDVAIGILPEDAYALLMLVDHDLYEDDDDDFCCGRAYGGSRVAVVSTARYNPALDVEQEVEREHAWPASHCKDYVDACCSEGEHIKAPPTKKQRRAVMPNYNEADVKETPITAAVAACNAHYATRTTNESRASPSTLWLGRVCKTASHELGHCFGMDHCVYYACIMQSTAGLSEDARQPPYLCPVDMAKLLHATGGSEGEWVEAMLWACARFEGGCGMFTGFGGWLKKRVEGFEGV
ncbi:hypothetical protein LTR08_007294 [Meristemomyces frigidus]|nr:hypothetical protein LTR08_007294 [Meristemomyces frigidus]